MRFVYPANVPAELATDLKVELSLKQLGFIFFCIGQIADDPKIAKSNRKEAQKLYLEMKAASEEAEIE